MTFNDGTALDAGDVLASVVAAWDATGAIRAAAPDDAYGTWDKLFGGPLGAGG